MSMSNRYKDALAIWEGGACNTIAVSESLTRAIREVRQEGADLRTDPACKLIADQLCQLLGLPNPLIEVPSTDVWKMRDECFAKGKAKALAPEGVT